MGFALPDLDQETLDELIVSIHEALDEVEPALEQLAQEPSRTDILNDLFRNLHTIKGNFRMCFLEPFTDYVHELEDTVSEVRKGRLHFTPTLKDALLIGLDKLRYFMDVLRQQGECDIEEMQNLGRHFQLLATADAALADQRACELFDLTPPPTTTGTQTSANDSSTESIEQDLTFYKNTALKLDQRLPNRNARTTELFQLLEHMLCKLDYRSSRQQLDGALYLHDIGLGVVSAQLLVEPTPEHNEKFRNHPRVGHQYLSKQPQWQEAATIILQHHEHLDGSGYPQGLTSEQIHPGAKLLNVLSDFLDKLKQYRGDLSEKRAVLKALLDINTYSGSRYDSNMVTALTEAARELYAGDALQ